MKKLSFLLLVFLVYCNEAEMEFIPEVFAEASISRMSEESPGQYLILGEEVGTASFEQSGHTVRLTLTVYGMTPNSQSAVHIHEGTLEAPGNHWNQGYFYAACDSVSLGSKWDKPYLGDVGNIEVNSAGEGQLTVFTDLWKINSKDLDDVLGKTIIIHQDPQDFSNECTPNHSHDHMNEKIAGGVISLVSDAR